MVSGGQCLALGALLCLGGAFAPEAVASKLSYTFLDFRYANTSVDARGAQTPVPEQTVAAATSDGDGVSVAGSIAVGERFYLAGSYQSSIVDVSGVVTNPLGETAVADNFDLVLSNVGFGYQKQLAPNLDLNVELTYDQADYDFGSFAGENFDTNDSGVGAKVGIRWNPIEQLEVAGFARSSAVGRPDISEKQLGTDTLVGVGVSWYFIKDLGVGVNYEAGTIDTLTISMRFSFGRLPL